MKPGYRTTKLINIKGHGLCLCVLYRGMIWRSESITEYDNGDVLWCKEYTTPFHNDHECWSLRVGHEVWAYELNAKGNVALATRTRHPFSLYKKAPKVFK